MSQNDLSIANQGFASFRSDLNSALQALGSTNSGTSAPSTTYANQLFYDTTNNILKIRNEDNDAFISLFTLDQTNDNIESLAIDGDLSVGNKIIHVGDTDTYLQFSGSNEFKIFTGNTENIKFDSSSVVVNNTGANIDFRIEGDTREALLFVDAGNDMVGIGTDAPHDLFSVKGVSGASTDINFSGGDDTNDIRLFFGGNSSPFNGSINYEPDTNNMHFKTSGSERLRINSAGSAFIGNTAEFVDGTGTGDIGIQLNPIGLTVSTRNGGVSGIFGRQASDGELIQLKKDGAKKGAIGIKDGQPFMSNAGGTGNCGIRLANNAIIPTSSTGAVSDNGEDLGAGDARFDDIHATNGNIQTSDKNEKQDIEELNDAEKRVAIVAKGLMRKFRWKDKVAEKGDKARTHFGIIAQDLEDAFKAEGLDASKYAMFCSDTWTNDDGKEQTRLGIRYPQLLAFIISSI